MSSLVHYPELQNGFDRQQESDIMLDAALPCFFRSIPPERVGLNGEYDHSGLAKRVDCAIRQAFAECNLNRLKITQRGRVVVFNGYVPNAALLEQLVDTAAKVSGATDVETQGVTLIEQSPSKLRSPMPMMIGCAM